MRFTLSALTLGVSLLLAQAAQAVSLTEPVSPALFADTSLNGTTAAARPELAGTVLEDVITPFSFSGVTGTVQNRVVRETGTGTLDFYWKVDVDASTTGLGVSAFRLADFGYANLKDADWRIDGLGNRAPDVARLFNAASYPTGDVNFLFFNGIAPGSQSAFFFLHTGATAYDSTAKFDLLTTGPQNLSGSFSTFAPSAVPEPSTYGLLAGGLLVMGGVLRRRRSA
ncbi:MAG TPA: PEP-CTERM sorting domain-containing protein [Aquabacterium sp.]|uniref:PEP-CTERM sorting domain-containing protein n=1 Tax=Aquabacterium sp. TaxID=1872578 RepID=UPI002E34D57A|nr:PEP-CTERM sorting domain-containing protein [Aquabacterium sp.]HEX5357495.1 PEP-CTERM sorting domain-containing protein [Aquabacterium sp.]